MTRSTSRRTVAHDWAELRKALEAIDTQGSTDELVPAWQRREIPEPRWAPEYVPRLQQSLEQRDHAELLKLLDAGRLIHPILLPVLADVLRSAISGVWVGRPSKLTETQQATLQSLCAEMCGPGRMTKDQFAQDWAGRLGVSASTIKRALKDSGPSPRQPATAKSKRRPR